MAVWHLFYMRSLRGPGKRPASALVDTVKLVNEKYRQVGVDCTLELHDYEDFLNSLSDSDLSSILPGDRGDSIEAIQTPISFDEYAALCGLENDGKTWSLEGRVLYDIDIGMTDEVDARFIRTFDIFGSLLRRYGHKAQRAREVPWGEYEGPPEEDARRGYNLIAEAYACNQGVCSDHVDLDAIAGRLYLKGDLGGLNSVFVHAGGGLSLPDGKLGILTLIDRAKMYVNSIADEGRRRFGFERLKEHLCNGVKENRGSYVKVRPDLYYERQIAHYVYNRGVKSVIDKGLRDEDFSMILQDTYSCERFSSIDSTQCQIYLLIRPTNDPNVITVGDKDSIDGRLVEFLLLHEIAHKVAGRLDSEALLGDDTGHDDLMLSPVDLYDLVTGHLNIPPEKVSLDAIRAAYAPCIHSDG